MGLIELHTLALSLQDWGFDKLSVYGGKRFGSLVKELLKVYQQMPVFLEVESLFTIVGTVFSFLNVLYFLSNKEVCFIDKWKHFICGFFFRSSFWSLMYRTS